MVFQTLTITYDHDLCNKKHVVLSLQVKRIEKIIAKEMYVDICSLLTCVFN